LAATADRKYLDRVNKDKPNHKHRKATQPSIVSKGHCYATINDHNLDSDPEVRIDVTNCSVCVCETPNYFEQLKANENVEHEAEDVIEANVEDVQVEIEAHKNVQVEVETNVEDIQVEVEVNVDVQVEVETNVEDIQVEVEANVEATSTKVAESIQDILEKDDQSSSSEIRNSFIDAVIDQALATTTQDISRQPKLSKHAKKRQLRGKENNGMPAKKINTFVLNTHTNLYENC
jgi:hypothetical protein